jgi:hypothetical protein
MKRRDHMQAWAGQAAVLAPHCAGPAVRSRISRLIAMGERAVFWCQGTMAHIHGCPPGVAEKNIIRPTTEPSAMTS